MVFHNVQVSVGGKYLEPWSVDSESTSYLGLLQDIASRTSGPISPNFNGMVVRIQASIKRGGLELEIVDDASLMRMFGLNSNPNDVITISVQATPVEHIEITLPNHETPPMVNIKRIGDNGGGSGKDVEVNDEEDDDDSDEDDDDSDEDDDDSGEEDDDDSDEDLVVEMDIDKSEPSSPTEEANTGVSGIQPNNTAGGRASFLNTITAIFNKDDIDSRISMFKVPSPLTSAKPEAYVPQLIGLGPIHHWRIELQHMQMYKVVEAKRIHKGFQSLKFERLVKLLKQLAASSVRASYNIYLEIEDDVLACIMAIDGLFLFGLLCCYGIDKESLANSSSLCHLVKSTGRLAQETTIQEAMMLENQIPIFVLKFILIIECWQVSQQKEIVSVLFPKILLGFCEFVSPLKTVENYPLFKTLKHAHLLDLLYHLVTLKLSPKWNLEEEEEELRLLEELSTKVRSAIQVPKQQVLVLQKRKKSKAIVEHAIDLSKILAPLELQKPIELVQGLLGLPWSQVRSSISSAAKEEVPATEILFPRASELHKAGVRFCIADHITSINFHPNTVSFYLPLIRINVNSEVIIRNLVVYEALIKSEKEPMILNWFVQLMNWLIQTAEDVKVLKDQGIISTLDSIDDVQVAKIFGGMNKSVKLTNTPDNLVNAVRSVKSYYNHLWRVSAFKFINKWQQTVWNWCKIFSVLLILLLMSIQTFCSVYECPRFSFKVSNASQAQQRLRLPSLRSSL